MQWPYKKDKGTNNDLQNITHKNKDRLTRTPPKIGVNSGAPEGPRHLPMEIQVMACNMYNNMVRLTIYLTPQQNNLNRDLLIIAGILQYFPFFLFTVDIFTSEIIEGLTSDVQEELPYYSDLLPSNESEKPIKFDTEPAKDQQDNENETNDTEQKTEDNDEYGMLVN